MKQKQMNLKTISAGKPIASDRQFRIFCTLQIRPMASRHSGEWKGAKRTAVY